MATSFLLRAPRPLALGLSLTTTTLLTLHTLNSSPFSSPFRPLLLDSGPATSSSSLFRTYQSEAKTPVVTKDGHVNRAVFRQVSSGSILGLASGIAVSMFSKTLTFLVGLSIAGIQYLESRGWHVVPTERIQKWVKGVDVTGLVRDNVAFKVAFGTTFALAAFAEL